MSGNWAFFLACTLLAVIVQALFALFEMASISFNKIRLQYYVNLGQKRALWLNYLLQSPSRLFGTALIGINTALQIGSECSRRFYESIHLDPDWAPLTQVLIVVVFAELAPLCAARRYPEQAAMALAPLMVILSRILSPLIWAFDSLSQGIHWMMGKARNVPLFLSREEVRLAFEETEEGEDELNRVVGQIFQLKNTEARQLMTPLSQVGSVLSSAILSDARHLLSVRYAPFIVLYQKYPHNVVAVADVRDLLRVEEHQRILSYARSPWFVTQGTSVLDLLDQFKKNNQRIALLLDASGQACGYLTLDQIVARIFGPETPLQSVQESLSFHIERTLPGEMFVAEFNREFQADLADAPERTLSDLICKELEHPPAKGETVRIGSYLFTILEPSLRGVKTIAVETD
ncbi:MAG: DUF21 domain-containing protein [Chlamydiia bacterium]|nr:DUF21 domain-containing protein [Chlamydiia bacterium]